MTCYEIRLAESLDESWGRWFQDMDVVPLTGPQVQGTLLRGPLPDQAALFGLLARVRDLNLTLIEVRNISEEHSR